MKFYIYSFLASVLFASAVQAAVPEFTVVIKDHLFTPNNITLPADTKVKLIIDNQDSTAEEFESHDLKREKVIAGNTKATVMVGPLKPGTYTFFGEFHPKTAQGTLTVK